MAWTSLRGAPYEARPPSGEAPRPLATEAGRTLELLADALGSGDAEAAARLAPEGDDEARALLRAVAANAGALGLREISLRYVDEAQGVDAGGSWAADVDAGWRLPEDRRATELELRVGLEAAGAEVRVVGLGGGAGRTPLWLSGPVEVLRAEGVLVVDRAGEGPRVLRLATRALPVVRRVLPGWAPRLVVEVPATGAGLDAALGTEPGSTADVAAVTESVDGSGGTDAPEHVFVNPQVLARLSPLGAQVVMSHEAAHVAVGAADAEMPLWLLEGFADHVALRDVDLPVSTTAAQVVAQVRREGVPRRLPTDAAFSPTGARLGAAYEAAWLACEVIEEAAGEQALVDLYRAVDAGGDLGAELERVTGLTLGDVTARWRERLSDLAG